MSLKPTKFSDSEKGWMQKRRDSRRMIRPEYHLIVTEGTKTEPKYFRAIKDIINQKYKERIQLDIFGEGKGTLNLLKEAQKRAANNPNGYKHVWIVFDTDDFPAEDVDAMEPECEKLSNDEITYHAIWSNQCIELWFLLHFSYMHSDLHRYEYFSKLSDEFGKISAGRYAKNRDDLFTRLRPFMEKAIGNAEKLEKDNHGRTASQSAPGTQVHKLIKKLLPYLDG